MNMADLTFSTSFEERSASIRRPRRVVGSWVIKDELAMAVCGVPGYEYSRSRN